MIIFVISYMVFLSLFQQLLGYVQLGHYLFHPHPFHLIFPLLVSCCTM